jgi:DNA-binding MarR family transcriptional regulator
MYLLLNYLKLASLAEQAMQGRRPDSVNMTEMLVLVAMADTSDAMLAKRSSAMSVTELATIIGCQRARVSAQLANLVQARLVRTVELPRGCTQDRRERLHALTPKGSKAAAAACGSLERLESALRHRAGILRRRTADPDARGMLAALEEMTANSGL